MVPIKERLFKRLIDPQNPIAIGEDREIAKGLTIHYNDRETYGNSNTLKWMLGREIDKAELHSRTLSMARMLRKGKGPQCSPQ